MPANSDYHRGRIFQNRAELRVLVEAETLQKLRERIEDSTLHVSQSGLFNLLLQWIIYYDIDLSTVVMNCDEFLERANAAGLVLKRPMLDDLIFNGELLGTKFNKRYMLLRQSAEAWLVEHAAPATTSVIPSTAYHPESVVPLEYYLAA